MKINTYTKILNNAVAAYALNNAIAKIEIFKDRALGSWRSFFLNKKLEINKNGTAIKMALKFSPDKTLASKRRTIFKDQHITPIKLVVPCTSGIVCPLARR